MKILLIGDQQKSRARIQNFSGMWSWYLSHALEALGHEVRFVRPWRTREIDDTCYIDDVLDAAEGCDAVLALGVRQFTHIPEHVACSITAAFSGPVAQIHDAPIDCQPGLVDLTLSIQDGPWSIGWAADPELFYPEQSGDKVRIFIDHTNFGLGGWDYSLSLMMSLKGVPMPFEARTLTDQGIELIDPENPVIRPYRRTMIPIEDFARELRRTDVFVVTHKESLGQTVLEAATCGALIVTPPECIPIDRLQTVEHRIVQPFVPWGPIIREHDREACRQRAGRHTWSNVAQRVVKHLANYRALG